MRAKVPTEAFAEALAKISRATQDLAIFREYTTLASDYEVIGIVMEEISLYTAAMMKGDQKAAHQRLINVARTATFGIACQLAGTMD